MTVNSSQKKVFVKLLITVSIFAIIFHKFDIQFVTVFSSITDWRYILLAAVLPLTIVPFISVNRWQLFLRFSGINERLVTLWRISFISLFQGLILPSSQGGDFFRIYHIEKRYPAKRGIAGSTVFVERLMGLLVLCGFSLLSLPFVAKSTDYTTVVAIVLLMNAAAFAGLILVLNNRFHRYYSAHQFRNVILARGFHYLEKFHAAVIVFPYKKIFGASLLLIGCFQVSVIFVVYLVLLAYGYNIPFIQHLALYPVVAILSMAPITIGGFGLREGFFVYFYGLLGVPAHVAFGASLLNYMLLTLVPALCGGVFYLWESLHGKPTSKPTESP